MPVMFLQPTFQIAAGTFPYAHHSPADSFLLENLKESRTLPAPVRFDSCFQVGRFAQVMLSVSIPPVEMDKIDLHALNPKLKSPDVSRVATMYRVPIRPRPQRANFLITNAPRTRDAFRSAAALVANAP